MINVYVKRTLGLLILLCMLSFGTVVGAADKDLGEIIQVNVTGQAPIEGELAQVKERALQDAFRNALEKALGARITAVTVMEQLTITSDLVISQTWGHLLSYEILEEKEKKGQYVVDISAEVSSDARWWAEFEGSLDVNSLRVKNLALMESYILNGSIYGNGLFHNQVLVVPIKTSHYKLSAFHTGSNQRVWEKELPGKLVAPLTANEDWLVAVTMDELLVINLQYGWIKWRYQLPEPVFEAPIIYNNNIYLTTQKGNLITLGLKKGTLGWRYDSQSFFLSGPAIAGDRIYFVDGQGNLHALDLNRHTRIFKTPIHPKLRTTPMTTRVFTYLGWNDGYDQLRAVDSLTGEQVWDFKGKYAPATTVFTPYLFDNKILGIFSDGKSSRLYLVDAKSGQKLWQQELDETITNLAGAGGDLILFNTWQGIQILDAQFGSILWESGSSGLKTDLVIGGNKLFYLHDEVVDVYQ